jgi:hypothetical protein
MIKCRTRMLLPSLCSLHGDRCCRHRDGAVLATSAYFGPRVNWVTPRLNLFGREPTSTLDDGVTAGAPSAHVANRTTESKVKQEIQILTSRGSLSVIRFPPVGRLRLSRTECIAPLEEPPTGCPLRQIRTAMVVIVRLSRLTEEAVPTEDIRRPAAPPHSS